MTDTAVKIERTAALRVRTSLSAGATQSISAAMKAILADVFALYFESKNFHWYMSGPQFRDYHLMLDEHTDQICAMTDSMAERVRKLGDTTIQSIGGIARLQSELDNDADFVMAEDMSAELRDNNMHLAARMRELHGICDECGDIATAGLLEI